MATDVHDRRAASLLTVPNQLTMARLVLSIVVFTLIAYKLFLAGFVLFVVAASTDWLDGYLARKYASVSQFGRILDPFVDKIIICGSLVFLVAEPRSEVAAWMAVVVIGRELFVTALRSFLENQGADFSASFSGKLKMLLQCIAVGGSLLLLARTSPSAEFIQVVRVALWAAVVTTIYSGVGYLIAAMRVLRG
jgi:CDP-diacylglycerol---glycerol-3-phosphate 3-phosphatidyltransferase